MALKTIHVSDVPCLGQANVSSAVALSSAAFSNGVVGVRAPFKPQKFLVIGHRGSGMNMESRLKEIKENSILSFNEAGKSGVDFVEFDVQVTKDDFPIIFHDNFILTEDDGCISEKRVTDLTLEEFLCYGPQREAGKATKPLLRKTKDGKVYSWRVEKDECLCTLQEALERVESSLGFNIELKFDDDLNYQDEELVHSLQVILQVVFEHARDRSIIFSSFQPDAARLVGKLQNIYPVFFLTNGGSETYGDVRRNSLDEAIRHCMNHGLQGIVSEVRAIFRNPGAINRIKEANLALLSYGQLNNVPEAVYMQHLMGTDGVIVDLVKEITPVVSAFTRPAEEEEEWCMQDEGNPARAALTPKFSQRELSFLLKLIPELIQF